MIRCQARSRWFISTKRRKVSRSSFPEAVCHTKLRVSVPARMSSSRWKSRKRALPRSSFSPSRVISVLSQSAAGIMKWVLSMIPR